MKREVFKKGFYRGIDQKYYNSKITVYKKHPRGLVARFNDGKEVEVDGIWCSSFIHDIPFEEGVL